MVNAVVLTLKADLKPVMEEGFINFLQRKVRPTKPG